MDIQFNSGDLIEIMEDEVTGETTVIDADNTSDNNSDDSSNLHSDNTITIDEEIEEEEDEDIEDTDVDDDDDDVETEEEDENENEDNDDSNSKDDKSAFADFALLIRNPSGILGGIEEERLKNIETIEDLQSLMEEDFALAIDEYKESLNTNSKGLLNHLKNGGDVKDFIEVYSDKDYLEVKPSDIEGNESLAKEVILKAYKAFGFPDKIAQKKLDRLLDIEDEAKDLLPELQEFNIKKKEDFEAQTKEENKKKQEAQETLITDIKEGILTTNEFIPGRKVSSSMKKKVADGVLETWQEVVNNPKKYAPVLAFMKHYKLLDGNFDTVTNPKVSKSVEQLTKKIKSTTKNKNKSKDDRPDLSDMQRAFRASVG